MKSLISRVLRAVTLVAIGFVFMGCDREFVIENGKVPTELLPLAEKYVGTYYGTVERVREVRPGRRVTVEGKSDATLRLSIEGERLVAESNVDYTGPDCSSSIGDLKSIAFDGDSVSLTFDFHLGSCKPFGFYTYTLMMSGSASDAEIRTEVVISQAKYVTRKTVGRYTR